MYLLVICISSVKCVCLYVYWIADLFSFLSFKNSIYIKDINLLLSFIFLCATQKPGRLDIDCCLVNPSCLYASLSCSHLCTCKSNSCSPLKFLSWICHLPLRSIHHILEVLVIFQRDYDIIESTACSVWHPVVI